MDDDNSIQVGDLVKFIGYASYYKDAVGVVVKLYSMFNWHPDVPDSVVVYIAGKDRGRVSELGPEFHPLGLEEVVKI
tara:strand:- start:1970 stop:2200 length:231 start_codon:yes stop_codon:yes gene_type:complete